MNKVILMDKEAGITSFDLVYRERKKLGRKEKIGHAGTLDKFASGLMVILTGSCTKLCPAFTSFGKEYVAEIQLGTETDTLDPEGSVIRTAAIPSEEDFRSVLPSFIGIIEQVPPLYSAIHVNGKRAYREARAGNEIEMPSRKVEISSLELLSFSGDRAVIKAAVSKGTYIRSLARDIAAACGSAGHLLNLRRISVGPWTLGDIGKETGELLSLTGLFSDVSLAPASRKKAENGYIGNEFILSDTDPDRPFCFIRFSGEMFGIGEKRDGRIKLFMRMSDEDI